MEISSFKAILATSMLLTASALGLALGCSSGGGGTGGGATTSNTTGSGCTTDCDAGTDAEDAGPDPAHDPACQTADGGLFSTLPLTCVYANGTSRVVVESNISGTTNYYVCLCGDPCPCDYVCGTAALPPNQGFGEDASVPNVCVPK